MSFVSCFFKYLFWFFYLAHLSVTSQFAGETGGSKVGNVEMRRTKNQKYQNAKESDRKRKKGNEILSSTKNMKIEKIERKIS